MSATVKVALLGFSKFERATFESFFRLAHKRVPRYELAADVALCGLAIVNADDDLSVAKVGQAGKTAVSLMLGTRTREGAAAQVPRPINLMLVVRALDQMALALPAQAAAPAAAPAMAPAPVPAKPPAAAPTAPTPAPLPSATAMAPTLPAPLDSSSPAGPRAAMDHILVVDDSDIALRFMAQQLSRFGFEIHLARSGQEAIERVAKRHFEFVFLDVTMAGLDGFLTCKVIKRSDYPDHRPPPTVVMVTSRNTPVDRLRGTMAGADAYLTKPLDAAELLKVVGDREVQRHAYADTLQPASTII